MQNELLATSKAPATTLIGVDAPLPIIDLDKIITIVVDTYDDIAPAQDEKQFNESILAEPLEAFVRLLRRQQKQHILDIGCGSGWEVNFLVARGFSVIGIDASAETVQKASMQMPHGKFIKMNYQNLQFSPEETFDAIWTTRTLIHIPKALVVDLLAAWKRALKPGGMLGIGVHIGEREGWEIVDSASKRRMFYHYFAEGELEECLEAAGYQIVEKPGIRNEHNADGSRNLFVFAQRSETRLDQTTYFQYVQYDEDEKHWLVKHKELQSTINLLLRAGSLTPREQVNLCLLYDQLAWLDRADENKYKLAAQKLKLHLHTPQTLSTDDFEVWFTMGKIHLKLMQFSQAIACLEQAHKLLPKHFATLVRLSYGYGGLNDFDKAIATANTAEQLAQQSDVSDEEKADLYHALGNFYVSRGHYGSSETSISDRERGEHYIERACNTGRYGYIYISRLASLYNETRRYSETIPLVDNIINNEKIHADEELSNELYFFQAEAYMGMERYAQALANLDQVERYARATRDWDALAHVKLYQVRIELKRKDVGELSLDEIRSYLTVLYEHVPSPYVVESFRRDRENAISLLSAFYLIKHCLDEQEPPDDFSERLAEAIYYMEKMYERGEERDLNLLVLADDPSAVPKEIYKINCSRKLFGFDEVETELTEREMEHYRVWAVLALAGDVPASTLGALTYCIGRFYRAGYTIYIYDPKNVFPEIVRTALKSFFVERIEDMAQFTYMNMLYDEAREYLSSTRTSLGLSPIGIAPSRVIAQAEDIDLLPIEGEAL